MQQTHQQRVNRVVSDVTRFHKAKTSFRVFHGTTNSTRQQSFKRDESLDVSDFNHVLSIDVSKRTALVEPNVPMDQLLKATLKKGLLPPVVMEFPGITVGGGVQGGAGESSSWQWGCFNRSCNQYEMVLADGSCVTASPTENADLYHGTAGSYGTLGVMTQVEIQLVPARKYVELTYFQVSSFDAAVMQLQSAVAGKQYDYIDGIMFSKDHGAIICGKLSDSITGRVTRFTRAHDPWFYLHAEKVSSSDTYTETVPITDYLFRYDRGAFWVGRYPFERAGIPFNRFTRWLVDPLMKTRKLYEALQLSGASQQYIVQDMAVPYKSAVGFMEFIDKTLEAYPLWLCPMLPDKDSALLSNNLETDLAINVGIWSNRAFLDYDEFVAMNRTIEKRLREVKGKKWMYAHSYYTEQEFWNIYDKRQYAALRKKYRATNIPTVYEKIRSSGSRPITIKRAALKTLVGFAKLSVR